MHQTPEGYMEVRIQHVVFTKSLKDGQTIKHNARLITYVDAKKRKLITLLTNDMEFDPDQIIAIYRQRWEIELLFYDKRIVMRSEQKSTTDYQSDRKILIRSASHNNNYFFMSFSQFRRFLLLSQDFSDSRLGVRSVYAFSSASRFAFESARA